MSSNAQLDMVWAEVHALQPSWQNGGIDADSRHHGGYHVFRERCYSGDYSTYGPRDNKGNPSVSDALDVTPGSPAGMAIMTLSMRAATLRRDSVWVHYVREFAGRASGLPLDSNGVYAMEVRAGAYQVTGFDSSHQWHGHISFSRDTSTLMSRDHAKIIASIIAGVSLPKEPEPIPLEENVPYIAISAAGKKNHLLVTGPQQFVIRSSAEERALLKQGIKAYLLDEATHAQMRAHVTAV